MCAHIGSTKNICDICIPLVDISPPIYFFVEKFKCKDGPIVLCDNLLQNVTENIFDIISWHIQRRNMSTSDSLGQGFHSI